MTPLRSRISGRTLVLAALLATLVGCAAEQRQVTSVAPPAPVLKDFEATAYSVEGKTATGDHAREGICAADPKVLPLGSRIRVHEAGQYSGEYVVSDTGRTIKGQEIDIYLASDAEAKRFGRKKVRVELLSSSN
jgi:3D (Asp-Asp-Asp) domain-containing protein